MLSQGNELAALDFSDIIGGPLTAVIQAQAKAAAVTMNFIQKMAFVTPTSGGAAGAGGTAGSDSAGTNAQATKQLQTVSFDFSSLVPAQSPLLGQNGGINTSNASITVPILAMIPIPFIRVESMTISLNVSLVDTSSTSESNSFYTSDSSSGSAGWFFSPRVSWTATVTDQNTYQNGSTVDDTYSLAVTVNAVQDQMPGGLSTILGIFTNVVSTQAGLVQSVISGQTAIQQALINQAIAKASASTTSPTASPTLPPPR